MGEPFKVIYIASLGHSGSTLLDLLVGTHSAVASIGEIKVLSARDETERARVLGRPCNCGARPKHACGFWKAVEERLMADIGRDLRTIDVESDDPEAFAEHNAAIFRAAGEVGGVEWIVDSSKNPERLGRLLAAGFDVRPVHLLRSPQGVVFSQMRKRRGWLYQSLRHTDSTLVTRALLARVDHFQARYEDLVADPAGLLARLMGWLGLSYEPAQLEWAAVERHNMAGNRMRYSSTSEIALDEEWRRALSPQRKFAIEVIALPLRLPEPATSALWVRARRVVQWIAAVLRYVAQGRVPARLRARRRSP